MLPQHLARQTSFKGSNESFLTQGSHFHRSRYVSTACSGKITTGRIHVTNTSYRRQAASQGGVLSGTSNWRNRCRRTSRACCFLAWLSSWQPARSLKKKNSSLLSPRPSRWSRPTPANTSKHQSGPARLWPLPVPLRLADEGALAATCLTTDHFSVKKYRKSSVYFHQEVEICKNLAQFWPYSALRSHCRPVVALRQNLNPSMSNLSMTNTALSLTAADVSVVRRLPVRLRPIACRPRPLTANQNPVAARMVAAPQAVASRAQRRAAEPLGAGLRYDAVQGQPNLEGVSC